MALKKACYCHSLALGTQIIGVFGIFNAMLHLLCLLHYGGMHADYNMIVFLIHLVVSVLLIVGATQKNNGCLVPWLMLYIGGLIIFNIIVIGYSAKLLNARYENDGRLLNARNENDERLLNVKTVNSLLTVMVLTDLICGYLGSIVLSLYYEIEDQVMVAGTTNV